MSSRQSPRALHVGLLWHTLGHDNLGVDALSRTNLALVQEAMAAIGADVRFTTFGGRRSEGDLALPDGVAVGTPPSLRDFARGRWAFFREIAQCDVVFDIGEGDSFTDIYGGKRLAIQLITKLAAIWRGIPLVLSPQTIGPFERPLGRLLAVSVMNRARAVFARDHLSKGFLDGHVDRTLTDEFIDVAFALPFEAGDDKGPLRVGLNVSGLLFSGGYSGKNELGLSLDYAELNRRLISRLHEKGAEVHLFAHVTDWRNQGATPSSPDDDRTAIATLNSEFPQTRLAPIFSDASAAKSWMSGLDFVVAGRMHACIGAFSAGVPVVPIAYSRKFNGLFQSLGYDYFVDGKSADTQSALDSVLAWFDRREELRAAVAEGKSKADMRLDRYRARLREALVAVARKEQPA